MAEEFEPVRQSQLAWFFGSLGAMFAFLLFASALFAFVVTLVLVARGRGPLVGAALLFVVPLPFVVGVFAAIDGLIASFQVLAHSAAAPKASELAEGYSTALVAPFAGLLLMAPSYLCAMVGLTIRSMGLGGDAQK